jgi:hypothetical protein
MNDGEIKEDLAESCGSGERAASIRSCCSRECGKYSRDAKRRNKYRHWRLFPRHCWSGFTVIFSVYNPDTGEVYGNSKEAAKKAIALTCFSRVIIAAGCLAIPPVMTSLAVKGNDLYCIKSNAISSEANRPSKEAKAIHSRSVRVLRSLLLFLSSWCYRPIPTVQNVS